MIRDEKPDKIDWLAAGILSLGALALLLATMDIGITRDESFYFHAAHQYIGWFEGLWTHLSTGHLSESFTKADVDRFGSYNPVRPVVMKSLCALSHKLFHDKLEWMTDSTAFRLPGALSASALVGLVFIWTRQLAGRSAGLVAAAAILFQPRFFFHAHMACFDVPITFFWFAVVYAYWRSFDSKKWAIGAGILWGLALGIKLNAFFIPFVLGGHWVLANARLLGKKDGQWSRPKFPWVFVSMLFIGTVLFFGLWPRHWFDTVNRVEWYLNFHLKHVHYFVNYFGQNLQKPPFPMSFPWVMTLVTVPLTILASAALGVVGWVQERDVTGAAKSLWHDLKAREWFRSDVDGRGTGLLLLMNALFPIALISVPSTPIFGGTKHWMPAMPFLAIMSGVGVAYAAALLSKGRDTWRPRAMVVLGALVVSSAMLQTAHIQPFGTSYYNEAIGSVRGAADAGMMRQFWGYSSRQALPWINENAPQRATVFIHNTTSFAWGTYRREKLVRQDLRATSMEGSQFALFEHQKAFQFNLIDLWDIYETRTPVHVIDVDGVPILSVFKRAEKK